MGLGVCSPCSQQCHCNCTQSEEGEGGNVDGHIDEVVSSILVLIFGTFGIFLRENIDGHTDEVGT